MSKEIKRMPTDIPVFVEPRIQAKADGSADLAMTVDGCVDVTKLPEGVSMEVFVLGASEIEDDVKVTEEELEQQGYWVDGVKFTYGTPPDLSFDIADLNKEYSVSPELVEKIMEFRVLIKKMVDNVLEQDIETFRESFLSYKELLGDVIFNRILDASRVYENFERLQDFLSETQEKPA